MPRVRLEVADIFRTIYPKVSCYQHLSGDKQRVIYSITSCRTKVLGGHVNRCTNCGYEEQSYNSCWNRHCPKCRGGQTFRWVEARQGELLPVNYYHLVFTLPSELRELCYANKRLLYVLLFRTSAESLQAAVESRFDAQVGHFGVIHSWNQELLYHPHVHHVVPAVGLSSDKSRAPLLGDDKFFIPVRVLSKLFRGKFIFGLKKLYEELYLEGDLEYLKNLRDFEHLLSKAASNDWVVYAKRPFAGPESVIKYLAGYTHRVAISDKRLRELSDTKVSFSTRDPNHKGKKRLVKLKPTEFTRRFLLHLIPKGFKRIRYFGFLLNRERKTNLNLLKSLLPPEKVKPQGNIPPQTCPQCKIGLLRLLHLIKPHRPLRHLWFNHVPILSSA